MGKKEVRREDIVEALKKIAFGRANHGVELAYLEKATPQRVQRMDLSAVAEFKRSANGAVEVKFVDRVKALGVLYEMLGSGGEDETEEYDIVGRTEADPLSGKISDESPVGHALLGKAVGEKAEVLLPTGHTVEYTVRSITHAAN